jgi:hypothetical protein
MRLLILGESDSIGMALREPSDAWGNRIPLELGTMLGDPPETVHVRYYSFTPGHLDYLETILERGPFDAVVLSATKVGFTIFSADNRIRRILGNRAGDWFKEGVRTFDRRTRYRRPPGPVRTVNLTVHRAARKLIGQAADTSAKVVADGYIQAFARLARLEDTRVVVVAAPPLPGPAAKRRPKLHREVEWFRTRIREEAQRRYFAYFDAESILPPAGPERDRLFTDEVHKTPELHHLVGRAVAELVAAGERAGTGTAPGRS